MRTAAIPRTPPERLKLTMPEPLEHDTQKAIRDALLRHPAVEAVYRVNGGARVVAAHTDENGRHHARRYVKNHDIPDFCDLWVWLKPKYGPVQGFIEVKRRGKKPTDGQAAFLARARLRGHIAFWADDAGEAWRLFSEALN